MEKTITVVGGPFPQQVDPVLQLVPTGKGNLAVYSRLGDSGQYYIIDALANEVCVSKEDLPAALALTIGHFLEAIRRRSVRKGHAVPAVPYLDTLVAFSRKMQPAFAQIIERNIASGRWPGNFSFRCTHGFLSSRVDDGFMITRRNVDKTGLSAGDFVWVSLELADEQLAFWGAEESKPSIDAPVHRVIYRSLPWVRGIVHGHLKAYGEHVHPHMLPRWPCGAENEAFDILSIAPRAQTPDIWIVNIEGHGFVALLGQENPQSGLDTLSELEFSAN
jgi:hypothetical protein